MYRDSVDALTQLLTNRRAEENPLEFSEVVSISSQMRTLKNGIQYCSVQVKFESGVEYLIEAYGEEAQELYRRAKEHPTFINACLH